jgi:hypothetical protein
MSPSRFAFLVLSALSILLGACTLPTDRELDVEFRDVVHDRAARELPCAWESVQVSPLGGWAYLATGCGLRQTYECGFDSADFDGQEKNLYVCRAADAPPAPRPAAPSCGSDGG